MAFWLLHAIADNFDKMRIQNRRIFICGNIRVRYVQQITQTCIFLDNAAIANPVPVSDKQVDDPFRETIANNLLFGRILEGILFPLDISKSIYIRKC
jgi:hypothetical protein